MYHPLQLFDSQLNLLLSDEIPAENIHSSIPEYDRLIVKISYLQRQIQEMIQREIALEKRHSKMQLEKLRAQINPHFLLNTLNTLHWMALMEQQTEINSQVQSLSHLLSYNLDRESTHTSLGREVAALKEYVNLQKVRYDFHFQISTTVALSELNYPCPKFILQPLIENALLHGYRNGMDIVLKIRIEDTIEIEIIDTGTGMSKEALKKIQSLSRSASSALETSSGTADNSEQEQFGIGLQYVIHSLNSFSQGNYQFFVQSELQKGTSIQLIIPKMKGGGYYASDSNR